MKHIITSLITFLLLVSNASFSADEEADITRETLLARYAEIFAARTHFDEPQVVALEEDTRRYFYEREVGGVQDKDITLTRLHNKLLLYLNFFQINIKARGIQLSDWNYYRLLLDAVRTVDHRYLSVTTGETQQYLQLLQESTTAQLWRAVRVYQEHFPFLNWDFCARVKASCPQQNSSASWGTIEQAVAALNVAIDRLNSQVERLNEVAKSRSLSDDAITYQQAVQNYLRTYEELLAEPYGGLLLMISQQQHRKLLATPPLFGSYTLTRLKTVDVKKVESLFAKIAAMFSERIAELETLYAGNDKKALLRFLIKYHRQAVAEFLINYPHFFNIINYYLDVINSEYEDLKQRTAGTRRNRGFMIAGGLGLGYAALHHFFRFSKGQVLYFTALAGGAAATSYAALRQKSFVDVFALREQAHEMHSSLIMQQSRDLLHFLHQLGQLAQVRDAALWQGGLLSVYALFFVRHLRKAWHHRQLKKLNSGISLFTKDVNVTLDGFSLRKIGAAIEASPDLRHLDITERLHLVEKLFGNYAPFREWQKKVGTVKNMDDLNNEHITAIWGIAHDLQYKVFAPTDSNVTKIRAQVDDSYSRAIITRDLDEINWFIHRLFNINLHGSNIPPVR